MIVFHTDFWWIVFLPHEKIANPSPFPKFNKNFKSHLIVNTSFLSIDLNVLKTNRVKKAFLQVVQNGTS